MNRRHINTSQRGAQSSIGGLTYERDFIAFLCARLICKTENINKIICEYKNDSESFLNSNNSIVSAQLWHIEKCR
jgi:hypothetical protein